jgi:dTDP-4-amino-4,6-dideoxygalactose transaminase
MTTWSVPLADVQLDDEDLEAVMDAYRSGWLSMGPRTERFEAAFAEYTGTKHALAVANGTAALHLMCLSAGIGPGDEVVVPSLTFVATVNAIAYTGATPVFADVAGIDAPWLSAAAVERQLTRQTRAIMAMTYGGRAGETSALRNLSRRSGLLLLEDAAHATGARLGGRHLGTFGAAGAFSFFSNKNLVAGEGGALVSDDDELANKARLFRSHGMTTLTWDRHRGHASGYDVVALGFNYRIDEPRAALAHARLARLDNENRRRAAHVARYCELLAGVDGLTLLREPAPDEEPAHHLFAIVLDDDIDRDDFRRKLAERGVQTSVHYPPVHRFSIYSERVDSLPNTDAYSARTVSLPLFPHMSGEQLHLVVDSVVSALGNRRGAPVAS